MKSKKVQKQPLTLHSLMIALSYWGSAVRTMLFGFIATAIFVVGLSEVSDSAGINNEAFKFIYVMGSFLLLDVGFVSIARTYRLRRLFDVPMLLFSETLLAMLYIAPKIVVTPNINFEVDPLIYVLFIPIVVLLIRMLLGFLFGYRQR